MRVNITLTSHECDIHTLECDYYTQSVISTRIIILTRTNVITTLTTVISTRTSDFYTHSVVLTRISVIMTLTSVIFTSCVWCWHPGCDFGTLLVIWTVMRVIWTRMRVILTRYVSLISWVWTQASKNYFKHIIHFFWLYVGFLKMTQRRLTLDRFEKMTFCRWWY
jgi:hypothetical protein